MSAHTKPVKFSEVVFVQQAKMIRFILWTVFGLCAFGWAFAGLHFILPATLPFWLGLLIAAALRPLTLFFSQKMRIRRRSAAVFATVLFYTLLVVLLWAVGLVIWGQLCSLTASLPDLYKTAFLPALARFFEWLSRFLSRFVPDLADTVQLWMQSLASAAAKLSTSLSSTLLSFCTDLAAALPMVLITVLVTIFCSAFISLDYPRVMAALHSLIPARFRPLADQLKSFAATTLLRLLRAYLLLLLITFLELCAGLWLLGVNGFVSIAAIIALLDILPVLGTGTVLIPWAVISLLGQNGGRALGLFVLYLLITGARSLLEPKLVGQQLGLPPLVSLVSVYAGLRLFGVLGAVLMPCLVLAARFLWQRRKTIFPSQPS